MSSENLEVKYSGSDMNSAAEPVFSRIEIDTSSPFESVKEAANLFGGMGYWKPTFHKQASECNKTENEIVRMKEQIAIMGRDLIAKESETFDVLKELETTRMVMEELKMELQRQTGAIEESLNKNVDENGSHGSCRSFESDDEIGDIGLCSSSAPGVILLVLEQAKMILKRSNSEIADISGAVDLYCNKIEGERMSIEKTRQRLSANMSEISFLEDELRETIQKLEKTQKGAEFDNGCHPLGVLTREIQRLRHEIEHFMKVSTAARLEATNSLSEIEFIEDGIKTAEIRLEKASKTSEKVSHEEISQSSAQFVSLSVEAYLSLLSRALVEKKGWNDNGVDSIFKDDSTASKSSMSKKFKEMTEEARTYKQALEEAASRIESANRDRVVFEELLQKWKTEHNHKLCSINKITKFKNSYPSFPQKESKMFHLNGAIDDPKPILKSKLSFGKILRRKLGSISRAWKWE